MLKNVTMINSSFCSYPSDNFIDCFELHPHNFVLGNNDDHDKFWHHWWAYLIFIWHFAVGLEIARLPFQRNMNSICSEKRSRKWAKNQSFSRISDEAQALFSKLASSKKCDSSALDMCQSRWPHLVYHYHISWFRYIILNFAHKASAIFWSVRLTWLRKCDIVYAAVGINSIQYTMQI